MSEPAPTIGLVDWTRVAGRLRTTVSVLSAVAVVGWLVSGLLRGELTVGALGSWVGLALGLLFLAELVVVGGSALRGLLRAGERGERLAAGDVGILPPQLSRRGRGRD